MAEPGRDKKRVIDFSAYRGARTRASARRLARDGAAHAVVSLVAFDQRLAMELLLQPGRGAAEVAAARHLAMYLVHTLLHRTMTETGAVFRRDRTTVAHACVLVEDRRENGDRRFDEAVTRLETIISGLTAEGAVGGVEVDHAAG